MLLSSGRAPEPGLAAARGNRKISGAGRRRAALPLADQTAPRQPEGFVTTDIPARLDRLPWSKWHLLVVVALGITWLLDGLESNLAGALAGILKQPETLRLTDAQIGLSSSLYLLGAVMGALGFGYATDQLGRKKLFYITLILYLTATGATGLSWNFASFPLEIRALAIAIFYGCGTFAGGVFEPALYGYLVGTGSRTLLFWGYIAGAILIVCGGLSEVWIGVDAERKSLESIAAPLASRDAPAI